jgi:type I restriction enzyme S subunit
MIADLKPYPAMKDSGVPWLGEVPSTWSIVRNGRLFTQRNETGFAHLPILEVSLKAGIRVRNLDGSGRKQMMFDRDKYKRARKDDLAYNMMRMWQGAIGMAPTDGLVSPAYVVARPLREVEPKFFLYLFRTDAYMGEVDKFSHGIVKDRNRLYWEEFKQMPTPVPPPDEQVAIVRFLDHTDRQIRRYIRAKQKLIKLLEEQKQAIIHRAVTHGLDPNVRLKPSGVEWLGDVPKHWAVHRTKVQFRLRTEKSGVAHGHELLSIYTHIGVRPRKELEQKGNKASTTDDYWVVKRGDIIANKLLAWMGAIGVSHYDGVTSPAYDILMPVTDLVPDYYHHLFRTKLYLQQFKQRSRGIMDMRLRLYFDQFGQIPIPVPPVNEQVAIVNFYNDATADADRIIDRTQREISLLREYRARLIADVVTGKLDVRAAAAKLPDEPAEPDPLDDVEALAEGEEETESAGLNDEVPEEAQA